MSCQVAFFKVERELLFVWYIARDRVGRVSLGLRRI